MLRDHPHDRYRRHYVGAALSGSMAVLVALPQAHSQTERRTLSGDRVAIYNLAGRATVEGGGGSDVSVEISRGGSNGRSLRVATGDIRGLETLRVIYEDDRIVYPEMSRGSRTSISVNSDGTFGDDKGLRGIFRDRSRVEISASGSGAEEFADLRVTVPRGKSVELHVAVGDVHVANVDGDLHIDVAAASITTEHTRGTLSLGTGSGGVQVSDVQGDVDLDTGSGGVTINGVRGNTLKMDTGSGSITASDIDVRDLNADVGSGGFRARRVRSSRVSIDAGSGGAEIELLSDIERLTIDNGSGGVSVYLPESVGAQVEIETGSGGIDTDFPVQMRRWERNSLNGTIGDGRGRIHIESGSGRVQLKRGRSADEGRRERDR
jgi:lia operon protein LiaG